MESGGWDTRKEKLVVIGGGQAAVQLIESARQNGFEGSITLVSEEACLPYQRPPLSKQYLSGAHTADWLLYRPARFYEKYEVDLRLGVRADAIDRAARTIVLSDGSTITYDKLALTMGARARKLEVPGARRANIFDIRTLADVDALRVRLPHSKRAIIIGAGFIGLETAAILVQMGLDVTLLAAQERLIPKLGDAKIAEFLLDRHLLHGVKVVFNTAVAEIRDGPNDDIEVASKNGDVFAGDIILVGIGAHPNVELAKACGLECDDGIVVDEFGRTHDPHVYAAGDCTNHPNPMLGRRLRLETVHNAVEQGRTVGATIAGKELPYVQTPWVWSDQYDLRLQSVGVQEGYDHTVLRGDVGAAKFSLFYYKEDRLLAVNSVNQPAVFAAVRRLLNECIPLDPAQASDNSFEIGRLLPRTARLDFDVPWPTKFEKQQQMLAWGHE